MIKTVYWTSDKVPVILVGFYLNFNTVGRLAKNTQMSISMKIRLVETELFHVDRRTPDEANSHFSQRCERA
jgi:hypothetical protein